MMPVGIVIDGKLYRVTVSSHESPNAKLAPMEDVQPAQP